MDSRLRGNDGHIYEIFGETPPHFSLDRKNAKMV